MGRAQRAMLVTGAVLLCLAMGGAAWVRAQHETAPSSPKWKLLLRTDGKRPARGFPDLGPRWKGTPLGIADAVALMVQRETRKRAPGMAYGLAVGGARIYAVAKTAEPLSRAEQRRLSRLMLVPPGPLCVMVYGEDGKLLEQLAGPTLPTGAVVNDALALRSGDLVVLWGGDSDTSAHRVDALTRSGGRLVSRWHWECKPDVVWPIVPDWKSGGFVLQKTALDPALLQKDILGWEVVDLSPACERLATWTPKPNSYPQAIGVDGAGLFYYWEIGEKSPAHIVVCEGVGGPVVRTVALPGLLSKPEMSPPMLAAVSPEGDLVVGGAETDDAAPGWYGPGEVWSLTAKPDGR